MPRLSRFQVMQHAKPLIAKYFQRCNKRVFSFSDINKILRENRFMWMLSSVTTVDDFISFLVDKKILEEVEIVLPMQIMKRYIRKDVSMYEIALSINKESYLSHYSAMFLHNLTNNVPKNVYTNKEQREKNSYKENNNISLEQENIDKAFSRPMRSTNQIANIKDYNCNVYLLNGKYLNKLGVTDCLIDDIEVPITSIERTLIDITVRPNYAGGVYEVLNAYKLAKENVSVNRLISMLKKMKYIYPYHQAIGFYMERAGYKENLLNLVEKIGINYKFYLTYEIKEKAFSERWNLFFPKGL